MTSGRRQQRPLPRRLAAALLRPLVAWEVQQRRRGQRRGATEVVAAAAAAAAAGDSSRIANAGQVRRRLRVWLGGW